MPFTISKSLNSGIFRLSIHECSFDCTDMPYNVSVDEYILRSVDFAKPILTHLRNLVHSACPEVEETIKWGFPHFEYQGILCSMASFKKHCVFGFWNASFLTDETAILEKGKKSAMGQLGRITSVKDVPDDKTMIALVQQAVELNRSGVKKSGRTAQKPPRTLDTPKDLISSLAQNKAAKLTFERLSYSNKKEYIEWLESAKTEITRSKRLSLAIELLSEGKTRYMK